MSNLRCLSVKIPKSNIKNFFLYLSAILTLVELLKVIWVKLLFAPTVQVASTKQKPMQQTLNKIISHLLSNVMHLQL